MTAIFLNLLFSLLIFSFSAAGAGKPYKTKEELTQLLALPIDSLKLSTRTKNHLKTEGIHTHRDLIMMTEERLRQTLYLGDESFAEVKTELAKKGLRLATSTHHPFDVKQEEGLNDKLIDYRGHMLTLREIQILKMRFGIEGKRHLFREMSQVFNLAEARIYYLQKRALEKLYRFGYLTGKVKNVDRASDLTSEQIEVLIKELSPAMLADNNILSSREEKVLKMRFGIGESPRFLKEIGQVLNLSIVGVHRVMKKALQNLYQFGNSSGILQNVDSVSDLTAKQVEFLIKAARERRFAAAQSTPDLVHSIESTDFQSNADEKCPSVWKN